MESVIQDTPIKQMQESAAQSGILATAESFSSMAVVSRLPAGCCWEGATLRLISGQWFGPERARSAHQWAHFPFVFTLTCTAAPQLWVSLWRARAREGERETGSHFTRIRPISSLDACQLWVVWLQAKLIKTKQLCLVRLSPLLLLLLHHTYTVHMDTPTPHTHGQEKQDASKILHVIFWDSNGILMEHRCLLGVAAFTLNTHEMTQCPFPWFNHLMIIMSLRISSCFCFGSFGLGSCRRSLKDLMIKWWESRSPWQPHKHASDF